MMTGQIVESGNVVAEHIRGEEMAEQVLTRLSTPFSSGSELSNFLTFCAGRVGTPAGDAFMNGAARRIQKEILKVTA